MWADRFDPNRDEEGSIRKKLKVSDKNEKYLPKEKPISKSSQLFKEKHTSKVSQLSKEKPSFEKRERFKSKPSRDEYSRNDYKTDKYRDNNTRNSNENRFVYSKELRSHHESNIEKYGNKESDNYRIISPSRYKCSRNDNKIYKTDKYRDNNKRNSNENRFVYSKELRSHYESNVQKYGHKESDNYRIISPSRDEYSRNDNKNYKTDKYRDNNKRSLNENRFVNFKELSSHHESNVQKHDNYRIISPLRDEYSRNDSKIYKTDKYRDNNKRNLNENRFVYSKESSSHHESNIQKYGNKESDNYRIISPSRDEYSRNDNKIYKTDKYHDNNKRNSNENRFVNFKESSSDHESIVSKHDNNESDNCRIISPSCEEYGKNDNNIYKTDNNKQYSNENQFVNSEESSSDHESTVQKHDSNESDDYRIISDSDFELEKNVNEINDDSNCKTKSNEKTTEKCSKDNSNNDESNSKLYDSINIDNDEVDELLDKAYQEKKNNPDINNKKTVTKDDFKEYEKTVLEEVCINHFDILPENWIEATHKSGMPVYLHKKTRTVTLSRPYFLGPGDPKSHLAPLSAITCLQYKKGLEAKETTKNEPDFQISKLGEMIIPNAKVETAQENIIKESLTHTELQDYCQKLFKFNQVKVALEEVTIQKKSSENLKSENLFDPKNTKERPSLPDSTKLISFPVQTEDHDKRCTRRREWIMNPNGKSYVSILHEYLQQALKTQPWYDFKELQNSEIPYSATVVLNDVQYGVGFGNSKKQAKLNAARATLDILIPEMKNKIDSDQRNQRDPVIFDQIKVTDPRVTEFCAKTTEPSPYAMLLVCLQRNFGESEVQIKYQLNNRRRMLNQCTMTVGKHTASVACKNKRDGKQKASQVILGLLHPHIDNWGSLLRLYGNRSIKNAKEKKQEEQEITQLQSKAAVNQPNFAILNKLKEEMLKIRDQRKIKTSEDSDLPYAMLVSSCPYTIAIPSPQSEHESN